MYDFFARTLWNNSPVRIAASVKGNNRHLRTPFQLLNLFDLALSCSKKELILMFARALETIQSTVPRRAAYTRGIFTILAICLAVKALWFSRLGMWHVRDLVDFDAFHIIATRVWLGDVDEAYEFTKLVVMQREVSGGIGSFMPWTYPPQFNLLLAPFALIPIGIAYFLFTSLTLTFYIVVLRSVAGGHFMLLLIILFPAIAITLACGQNAFLTAGLIGLVCLFFEERPIVAGLALGLMVIKPHLAIAFAVYAVLRRSWTVVITAGAVVLITSAVCTVAFGTQIWLGFLKSLHDSSIFLERGYYPLYRMISFYAALRTTGLSAWSAFLGQGFIALLALGIIPFALYRKMPARFSLGLTAIVSICISPYAYDYDFLIFGMGLALLLPALHATAGEWERGIIYAMPMLIGLYGNLRSAHLGTALDVEYLDVISIGGFAVVALIALIFTILLRGSKPETIRRLSTEEPVAQASR
jgi:Glycosyltransferase family 87